MDNRIRCSVCSKKLQSHSRIMSCSTCNRSFHIGCLSISRSESIYVNRFSNTWICIFCLKDSLPFVHLDDDEYYDCTVPSYCHNIGMSLNDLINSSEKIYTLDKCDDNDFSPLNDIDPDEHYYRFLPGYFSNCAYYDEALFQEKCLKSDLSQEHFSLIHFNARSACRNLSSIENYLHCLNFQFSVVGLTETWYNESNVGLYRLPGFNQEDRYRSKRGGGVSIHIKTSINYKPRTDLDIFNDDIESVFY